MQQITKHPFRLHVQAIHVKKKKKPSFNPHFSQPSDRCSHLMRKCVIWNGFSWKCITNIYQMLQKSPFVCNFHSLEQIFGVGSSWRAAGDAFSPVRFHSLQQYRALWGKELLIAGGVWLLFPLYMTFPRVWWTNSRNVSVSSVRTHSSVHLKSIYMWSESFESLP